MFVLPISPVSARVQGVVDIVNCSFASEHGRCDFASMEDRGTTSFSLRIPGKLDATLRAGNSGGLLKLVLHFRSNPAAPLGKHG